MKNLNRRYLDYDTCYRAIGDVNVSKEHHACFSHIFHTRCKKKIITNNYTIYINKTYTYVNNTYRNNICFLKLSDIIQYLDEGKQYVPFEYTLTSSNKRYVLNIKIAQPLICHKFLLSYVRYLYEMPFALYLYEVFKLKQEIDIFKNESYFNLYNLVSATIPSNDRGGRIHHIGALSIFKPFVSVQDIQNKLKKVEHLEELFDRYTHQDLIVLQDECENDTNTNIWRYKKNRQKRYKTYINNYKILKK